MLGYHVGMSAFPTAPAISTGLDLPRVSGRQTLLFDADDTLWENNIYFERAIAGFLRLVNHPHLTDEEVRQAFNQLEHRRVQVYGYGSTSFRNSMLAAYQELTSLPCAPEQTARIHDLTHAIVRASIELLPGVRETLAELSTRHRLVLVTKGDQQEQTDKLERSGLASYFSEVEVVWEKHRSMYEELSVRHGCEAATTWMIGNSPKSDINPAIAAGLHAVYLPHPNTWVLEHEAVAETPPGQHLLTLNSFSELTHIF